MNEKDVADRLEAYLQKARDEGWPEGAEAEALAPLLDAAARVRRLRAYRLPESRRQRAKARLQAAWIAQEGTKDAATGWQRWLAWPGAWGHLRGALAATLALVLVATLTLTAVASGDPGSVLYPARATLERVPALLESRPESRAGAELRAADRRLADLSSHLERTGQPARAAVEALLKGDAAAAAAAAALDEAVQRAVSDRIAAHAAELARLAELAADGESKLALRSASLQAEQLAGTLANPRPEPGLTALPTATAVQSATTAPSFQPSQTPPSPPATSEEPIVLRPTERPAPATGEATRPLLTATPEQKPVITPGLRATAQVITPTATALERRPTLTHTVQPQHTVAPGARATALATITARPTLPAPSATAPARPGPGMRATALALTATALPVATPTPTPTPTTVEATATPAPTSAETAPPPASTPVPGRRATAMAHGNTPTPGAVEPTVTPTPEVRP